MSNTPSDGIEHNGRLRLIETKWNESGENARFLSALQRVRGHIGPRAADEHWLVCRTKHNYPHPSDPSVRVINGYHWTDWLPSDAVPPTAAKNAATKKVVTKKVVTKKVVTKKAATKKAAAPKPKVAKVASRKPKT